MNQAQMNARVGIFFIIGIVIIWITFQALHSNSFTAKDGYTVTASFKSVRELKNGNEVRMAGVPIGTVSSVALNGDRATATLLIRRDFAINRDATATIAMSGLIGSNYISLDFGNPASGTVPTDGTGTLRTRDLPDLNDVMTQLGGVGEELKAAIAKISATFDESPDGTPGLVKNLNNLVTENRGNLKSTIENLNEITTQVRTGQGTLGKLINDSAAYNELVATVTEIKSAASEIKFAATEAKGFITDAQTNINGILTDVKSGRGTIGALIYDEDTAKNLKLAMKHITDITAKMNNDQSSFGQLISSDNLVRDAKATLRKVDRAMDGASDSGPITAVGILLGRLW